MSKLELLYTIVLGVIVVGVLLYYLVLAIKNKWIKEITGTLNHSIKYAEENIDGKDKKKCYVMKMVEEKCVDLGIPWFLIKNLIDKLIERIIKDHNIIDHDE